MKCFIINYNRLGLLKNMADFLSSKGIDVYIIDNKSTYPPLLEYYRETKYNVIRMDKNYGYKVFWDKNIYGYLGMNERYLLSDPDLDISNIPDDFINIMEVGLDKYPELQKCGLSLEINDLPKNEISKNIIEWENRFWKDRLDSLYFKAAIDTTFAMYNTNKHELIGIRTDRPYVARHIPWYYDEFTRLPDDEVYYLKTIETPTSWSKEIISKMRENGIYK